MGSNPKKRAEHYKTSIKKKTRVELLKNIILGPGLIENTRNPPKLLISCTGPYPVTNL
jgi:hypothetical protein